MTTTSGAPVDLDRWVGLDDLLARLANRFGRVESRRRAAAYVRGLLASVHRKNGSGLALAAGDATADGMHKLLNSYQWDAHAVRDDIGRYVVERLGEDRAVLSVHEISFGKKGTESVGVQWQLNRSTRRMENCQRGVFLTYVSTWGTAFVDRDLYLPPSWTDDPARRAVAAIPDQVGFATPARLAQTMIERAVRAGMPFGWINADEEYGRDEEFRRWLESRRLAYVLAVPGPPRSAGRRPEPERTWLRHAGTGGEGAVLAHSPTPTTGWSRWLLASRDVRRPGTPTYHVAFGPRSTGIRELFRVAGVPRGARGYLNSAVDRVGLREYEVRRYHAWYRHVTLSMAAHAVLATTRVSERSGRR